MNNRVKLNVLRSITPDVEGLEREAVEWAVRVLGDMRIKELYVNLKNYDFDIMGTYSIDQNGAEKLLGLLRDMLEVE